MGNNKRNNEINKLFVRENIHNGIFSGSIPFTSMLFVWPFPPFSFNIVV